MLNYNSFMALSSYQPGTKHCSFKMGGGGFTKHLCKNGQCLKLNSLTNLHSCNNVILSEADIIAITIILYHIMVQLQILITKT